MMSAESVVSARGRVVVVVVVFVAVALRCDFCRDKQGRQDRQLVGERKDVRLGSAEKFNFYQLSCELIKLSREKTAHGTRDT